MVLFYLPSRYFSVTIFCKIGISGFIGGIIIGLSLFISQLLVLLITDRVSIIKKQLNNYVCIEMCVYMQLV